jgi:hypothetical protein
LDEEAASPYGIGLREIALGDVQLFEDHQVEEATISMDYKMLDAICRSEF